MVKRGVENFTGYLDGIAAFGSNMSASRSAGLHPVTALRWLAASREAAKNGEENTSIYYFNYAGKTDWLHTHRKAIEKSIVGDILANAMIRARDGATQPSMFQGRRVPALDYDLLALGLTEEEAIMRDPVTGAVVFETVWSPPSNELTLGVLGAFTKRFARRLDISHQHQVAGGVQVVHAIDQQKRLDHKQALPAVEIIDEAVTETVAEIAMADRPSDEENAPDVGEAEESFADSTAVEEEAQDSVRPAPVSEPAARVGMTPLQQDLIARARAKDQLP